MDLIWKFAITASILVNCFLTLQLFKEDRDQRLLNDQVLRFEQSQVKINASQFELNQRILYRLSSS